MNERNQVTIGIHRDKYDTLKQKKEALETALGHRVDWGTFFLTLASQRTVNEIVANIEGGEKEGLSWDYEMIVSNATKDDVKEIVNRATDKIISELKKHRAKSTRKENEKP